MRRMQSDAGNSALSRFLRVILSVADHRVADCRQLHADLILQSRHQRDPDQRSGQKGAFQGKPQFRASASRVALCSQLLKHSLPSKVVDKRTFFGGKPPANDRQILPFRRMPEKLPDQCVPIRLSFGKEQHPGSKAVDPMNDQRPLSLPFQFCGKKR